MKKFVSLILIVIVFAQAGIKLGIVAYYQINKGYITQQFCINKAKPKLQCNGKCYLAKKLKKAQEEEDRQTELVNNFEQNVYFENVSFFYFENHYNLLSAISFNGQYKIHTFLSPTLEILSPPRIA